MTAKKKCVCEPDRYVEETNCPVHGIVRGIWWLWHPIKTAPQDGQEVLLAISNGAKSYVTMATWSPAAPDWIDDYGHLVGPGRATHWMQLPDLPDQ